MRHYNPTKLPGGGRDCQCRGRHYSCQTQSLVIVFGVDDTQYPLVLVNRDSPFSLNFSRPPRNDNDIVPFQDTKTGCRCG